MTRSRMMKNDDPTLDEGPEPASPRTTIVGGQPPAPAGDAPPVPTGIQSLLRLASVDAVFRDEFLERRGEMADVAGLPLTDSERAILSSIPATQLRDMAEKMPPPPPARREFLRQSAASAVVLLGGAAMADGLTGCCDAIERVTSNPMASGGGAAPDWPDEPTPAPVAGDDDDSAQPTPAEPTTPEPPTEAPVEPPPDDPPPPVSRGAMADMPRKKSSR